jgi:mannose-6-phosphate isomerase-like protein (cupin superfamily)
MEALVLNDGEGHQLSAGGMTVTYKVTSDRTGDALGVYEITLAAQSPGAGLHFHDVLIEVFHVLSGTLSMTLDGRAVEAGPGCFVHVPPKVVHSFHNRGETPVRFVLTFAPALSREGFFEGLAALSREGRLGDAAAMREVMAKYDQTPIRGVEGWSQSVARSSS